VAETEGIVRNRYRLRFDTVISLYFQNCFSFPGKTASAKPDKNKKSKEKKQ